MAELKSISHSMTTVLVTFLLTKTCFCHSMLIHFLLNGLSMALYNRKGGLSNFPIDYLVIESFWITTFINRNENGIQENCLIKNKAKFTSFRFQVFMKYLNTQIKLMKSRFLTVWFTFGRIFESYFSHSGYNLSFCLKCNDVTRTSKTFHTQQQWKLSKVFQLPIVYLFYAYSKNFDTNKSSTIMNEVMHYEIFLIGMICIVWMLLWASCRLKTTNAAMISEKGTILHDKTSCFFFSHRIKNMENICDCYSEYVSRQKFCIICVTQPCSKMP